MVLTINSRKLGKPVTFTRPGSGYVYADLNGHPGTLGVQICAGGRLSGSTINYAGSDPGQFENICRQWFRAFIRNERV